MIYKCIASRYFVFPVQLKSLRLRVFPDPGCFNFLEHARSNVGQNWYFPKTRGPQYRSPNTIVLIVGTLKKVPLIWETPISSTYEAQVRSRKSSPCVSIFKASELSGMLPKSHNRSQQVVLGPLKGTRHENA